MLFKGRFLETLLMVHTVAVLEPETKVCDEPTCSWKPLRFERPVIG